LKTIQALCRDLGIWAVIGSCHFVDASARPRNSLYIIDPQGEVLDRYDKRFCSQSEITEWYSAGKKQVVFEVNGLRIGCATCIEIQFPEVFLDYEKQDVDCVLFSSYSDSTMFGIQAQGHAACNNYWMSMSVPTNKSQKLPSNFVGPSGDVISRCHSGVDSIVVNEINPEDKQWEVPLKLARPWVDSRVKAKSIPDYQPLLSRIGQGSD
jgi:predicted amidohydrolase